MCRYHLLLLNGVYNRKANEVEYQAPTTGAQLFDYTIPVGGGTLIGSGSASLMVQFF